MNATAVEAVREVVWGRPDWEDLRARRDRLAKALPVLKAALAERGAWSSPLTLTLSRRERALLQALSSRSSEHMAQAARDLAGLGEGSTPAGDDFLVGAMYGIHATLPREEATQLCASIAAAAAPRTTRLSARWLQRAAGGEAIPTWSLFLSSLANSEAASIQASADRVLGLGHTSGYAALSGFVAAVERLARLEGERA